MFKLAPPTKKAPANQGYYSTEFIKDSIAAGKLLDMSTYLIQAATGPSPNQPGLHSLPRALRKQTYVVHFHSHLQFTLR